MATAHLLHGYLGAGKTTLAERLAQEHDAVRFSPDEWMSKLFGKDPPAQSFQARSRAVLELMQPLWMHFLRRDVDVILDFGFWTRGDRDHARSLVSGAGATCKLYAVICADEEALQRISSRNADGDSRSLFIARETFYSLKERFEPLHDDEPHITL